MQAFKNPVGKHKQTQGRNFEYPEVGEDII